LKPSVAAAKAQTGAKDYLSAFAEAVERFAASSSIEEPLAQLPDILVKGFGAARAELWLWDQSSSSAYLTHASGQEATHRRDFAEADSGAVGRVLQSRARLQNAALDGLDAADKDFSQRWGLGVFSAYPLMAQGRLLGVLAAYTTQEVDAERLKWWGLFAEIAAIHLQQTLATQENHRTITQLSLLFEATRLLNSTLDLAELLELILRIARNEVGADRGTVFLVDKKRRELWSIVAQGLDHQEIRVPFGKGVAGHVAETGEPINVEDAYTLPYFEPAFDRKYGYRTKSLLCLPIRHHSGDVVGVIQLLNQQPAGRFSKEDQEFLEKLTGHMAMALENARLHREAMEKQRLEKELALARNIQRSLLPDRPPIVPGYDIGVMN
jgi:GAF domain-containing protein